jgi:metal-responsive CopG/Arc/MetJ family transcriptional regulator
MRAIVSISLDKTMKKKLDEASKKFHISKSEIVQKALEKYISHEEFRELRGILVPYAEKAGYFTDEDIFKDVS